MGIAPDGLVHISRGVRDEQDGPMLREGIQAFHGEWIDQPSTPDERPDPDRLASRFERFLVSDAA